MNYLRRVLLVCAAAAVIWAIVVALTGGFFVRIGPIRISSRDPGNALLAAIACGLAMWAMRWLPGGRTTFREEWSWWARVRVAPAAVIAAIVIVLDIYQWLGARPLWLDEEMIALNVRDRSFADLGGALWLGQSAPLGWLVVQRAVILAFGTGELAVRLVPVLFGIATVVAALWIGRRWLGSVGAAVLVLLFGFGLLVSHYPFEVKHYSADTFFALLLPALAVWATEADTPSGRTRRIAIWWAAATVGQYLANGALLVSPACAFFLAAMAWRIDGRRAAATCAMLGAVWLVFFAVHYQLSLTYTHHSGYLRRHWAEELPPDSVGPAGMAQWIAVRLEPLALNPAGTALWVSLWASALCGFVFSARRVMGLLLAAIPLSAFALASFGLVPLYQRFSLWIVPALYLGIALLVDWAMRSGLAAFRRRRWLRVAVAASAAFVVFRLSADIVGRGLEDLARARPRDSKQRLDDRAAVRWLISRRRPGDVLLTTHFGWPAIWWYGGIPIAGTDTAVSRLPDGSPAYEVVHRRDPSDCPRNHLDDALRGQSRALVYIGFRDFPDGFDDLLLGSLGRTGAITAYSEFAGLSRVAEVDLSVPGSEELTSALLNRRAERAAVPLDGCVQVRPIRRW